VVTESAAGSKLPLHAPRVGTDTPWGRAQHATELGLGLVSVSTASHGGIYVPESLLVCISQRYRAWAKKWSGSESWYEEDCCWAAVAVHFRERDGFTAEQIGGGTDAEALRAGRQWAVADRPPGLPPGCGRGAIPAAGLAVSCSNLGRGLWRG
jgi:hypothetical protein